MNPRPPRISPPARWLRRLRGQVPSLVYHPLLRLPASMAIDPERPHRIATWLKGTGALRNGDFRVPEAAPIADLDRVHDPRWLERLQDRSVLERLFPGLDDSQAAQVLALERVAVGGTVLAARLATADPRRPRTVLHLGGGFHHARRDQGSGFCAWNDVAVAIAALRAEGFRAPILVLDLDLHAGDGTRAIFARDPSVFTLSVHAEGPTDPEEAVADLGIALGHAVADAEWLAAVSHGLAESFTAQKPGLVFYVAGVDVAVDDALGSWRVSADAIAARDRQVVEACAGLPLVWTLAGGYGPEAWRHSARGMAWCYAGIDAPIPPSTTLQIEAFREVARTLRPADLGEGEADPFRVTTGELLRDLRHTPENARFLGYYTPFGIELALERYGLLPRLRELGFPHPSLDLDLDHPAGHRLRIFADPRRDELLVELVVRETREVPPFRLLAIEWLLVQDPRRPSGRPLLPGQKHPGLGLLAHISGILTMAAERLRLQGVLFRPGWYHMAVIAHGHMGFLDPAEEGRFSALKAALDRVPLERATRLVAEGRVVEAQTGAPLTWPAAPMVLALDPELRALLTGEERDRAAREAASRWSYRVAEPP